MRRYQMEERGRGKYSQLECRPGRESSNRSLRRSPAVRTVCRWVKGLLGHDAHLAMSPCCTTLESTEHEKDGQEGHDGSHH